MAVQSYAIYIRYPKTESNNKCKPSTENNKVVPNVDNSLNTAAKKEESNSGGNTTINGFIRSSKNPMGALIGNASKAFAPIAVGIATAKIIDSVVGAAIPFYVGYTGDTNVSLNYANFKGAINAIMNPIGTALEYANKQMELYQERLKIEQRRALTGNSIINNYGGKQVISYEILFK